MADPNKDADNFVEVDGVKYKEDSEKEGEALIGEDGEFVPFEEKKEEAEETDEEKKAREKKEEEDKKVEEGEEPPTRRSVKNHIIDRKTRKIKKLKKEKEEGEGDDEGEGDEEGEEEVTPEGTQAIKKEVGKAMAPVLNAVRTSSDEQELKDVLAKYPDAKKSEKQIRKYMENDAYKDVSIEFIYLGLAAKKMDLQKKRDKADEDAKADGTGGHGRRKKDLSPIPDVTKMDDKEVDDLIFKVKTGRF